MLKRTLFVLCIIHITSFCIFAEQDKKEDTTKSTDTTQNLEEEKKDVGTGSENATLQDTAQSETLTKKQLREKRRKEKKEFNDMTISAHKSMLVGSSDHKHGFTNKKKGSTKGPLKLQTICPVMGGPIDKRFYADYNGYRIYVCCEGCIYQLKRTPKLYVKTLKRYGEKPVKVPAKEPKTDIKDSTKTEK